MPIIKVFHTKDLTLNAAQLADEISVLVKKTLQIPTITPEILFLPAEYIYFGKSLYLEIDCKRAFGVTDQDINNLIQAMAKLFNIAENKKFKIRVLDFATQNVYGLD